MQLHVRAEIERQAPAGTVAQVQAANLYTVALGEEKELRAHYLAGAAQTGTVVGVLLDTTLYQRVDGERQLLALPVDNALARELDILGSLSQDEAILRIILAHHVAIAHHLELVVVVGIGTAQQHGTPLQPELYPALHLDGPGKVHTLADY